jgi:hypothetical protein
MTTTKPIGTLGSVASLLAATLCQENRNKSHTLWNIGTTERYATLFHNRQRKYLIFIYKY